MRPEDLVFWLDRLDGASRDSGVLCLRHADTMVVPRSWTLDDLRDPDLHLFRPPAAAPARPRARRSASPSGDSDAIEQLELGVTDGTENTTNTEDIVNAENSDGSDIVGTPASGTESWSPSFDDADDLGGLLSARSPLLARAFRGDERPRT
jgi:hypothetical protein